MKHNRFSINLLNNRFPALHGLRFLAILGVIQLHATDAITHRSMGLGPGEIPPNWGGVVSFNAWFAMDLFFIMSGFLIGHILFYSFSEDAPKSASGFSRFYFRRAFRTFPLYYIFLFGFFFLNKLTPVITPSSALGYDGIHFKEYIYLTNYPFDPWHYLAYWSWSLSMEEHFYLLSPFLVFGLMHLKSHRARLLSLLGLWCLAPLIRLGVYLNHPNSWESFDVLEKMYMPTHMRFDILVGGLILAYIHYYFSDHLKFYFNKAWFRFATIAAPVAIFLFLLSPELNPAPLGFSDSLHPEDIIQTAQSGILYFGTLTSIAFAALILHCIYVHSFITRFLSHRIFLTFATLGYGIYLVHLPIIYKVAAWMNNVLPNAKDNYLVQWLSVSTLTLAFSALLAYVLHLIVEKPFLYLRDRFAP